MTTCVPWVPSDHSAQFPCRPCGGGDYRFCLAVEKKRQEKGVFIVFWRVTSFQRFASRPFVKKISLALNHLSSVHRALFWRSTSLIQSEAKCFHGNKCYRTLEITISAKNRFINQCHCLMTCIRTLCQLPWQRLKVEKEHLKMFDMPALCLSLCLFLRVWCKKDDSVTTDLREVTREQCRRGLARQPYWAGIPMEAQLREKPQMATTQTDKQNYVRCSDGAEQQRLVCAQSSSLKAFVRLIDQSCCCRCYFCLICQIWQPARYNTVCAIAGHAYEFLLRVLTHCFRCFFPPVTSSVPSIY